MNWKNHNPLIHHITLFSGDIVTHRLDTLNRDVVKEFASLLPNGGEIPCTNGELGIVPFEDSPCFGIYYRGMPIVVCGIGNGIDALWHELVSIQNVLSPCLAKPVKGQWLAVVILASIITVPPHHLLSLGYIEQHMAAAMILESQKVR